MRAAIYARYSTELQRMTSIEDQLRVCARLAERHGLEIVGTFTDAAISGGTVHRPGYQSMLAGARRGEFEAIVAEDASRLWRNTAEQEPRLAELADLGVHVVTHDLDTRDENSELMGPLLGAMSQKYRKEIGRRTRRGLEGRARAGKPSGGRAYGYVDATRSGTGDVEINPEQAVVVRWIFERFSEGWSAIRIAADLNARRVPSPAAGFNRPHEARGWHPSTIRGAARAGSGILNIDLYRGVKIWGRTKRVRSRADSKRRKIVVQPEREWIVQPMERLRIVSDELWERVKARQRARTDDIGHRVRTGLTAAYALRLGRRPVHLFSGFLVCGDCGSKYTLADKSYYACAGRLFGRGCSNTIRVRRDVLEDRIKARLRNDLTAPVMVEEFRRRASSALAARKREPAVTPAKRIGELQAAVDRLVEGIASGVLRASPAIAERLRAAEDELLRLRAAPPPRPRATVSDLVPRLAERFIRLVDRLQDVGPEAMPAVREGLRDAIGPEIPLHRSEDGSHLIAHVGPVFPAELRQVVGLDADTGMYGAPNRS
jgi:site-specific DNA recombinase